MSQSSAFERFHPLVQRWIWNQQWTQLREVQEMAAEPILKANQDVVISAATAAGKTEAAFLPAISKILQVPPHNSVGILYISPLKALINDQARRLATLAEITNLKITPWHGDASQSGKMDCARSPEGILLITPESLESMLMKPVSWCQKGFKNVRYIIIDEFHSFVGTERGCQLQSLLHRLDFMLDRKVPRIALSATLGDLESVHSFLRPEGDFPGVIVNSTAVKSSLQLQLRAYSDIAPDISIESRPSEDDVPVVFSDLYRCTHGQSNLIFSNSRSKTEEIANALRRCCQIREIDNEYFAHHGRLAKSIRESLERRLQEGQLPTTAVCTSTLEMGIDIGHVDSVVQINAPSSVASFRQRLGRSGRRGSAALCRLFLIEPNQQRLTLQDQFRLGIFQSVAVINLMLQKWAEPMDDSLYHFSTLIQQTLSTIVHYGCAEPIDLYRVLCHKGAFQKVTPQMFSELIKQMVKVGLLTKLSKTSVTIGDVGEKVVGHYQFYAAFPTPQEYVFKGLGKVIGTFPIDTAGGLTQGMEIIMAGKEWAIVSINHQKHEVEMTPTKRGSVLVVSGEGFNVHRRVRDEMKRLYESDDLPVFCNSRALDFFKEARALYRRFHLTSKHMIESGHETLIFPWLSDKGTRTLVALLRQENLPSAHFYGVISVRNSSIAQCAMTFSKIYSNGCPKDVELVRFNGGTSEEKFDLYLPDSLKELDQARKLFNVDEAWEWLRLHYGS